MHRIVISFRFIMFLTLLFQIVSRNAVKFCAQIVKDFRINCKFL